MPITYKCFLKLIPSKKATVNFAVNLQLLEFLFLLPNKIVQGKQCNNSKKVFTFEQ
jgi:hypothetical protein